MLKKEMEYKDKLTFFAMPHMSLAP